MSAAVDPAAIEEARRALGRALLLLARECAAAETSETNEGRLAGATASRPREADEEPSRAGITRNPDPIVHPRRP